jgi:tetratricopeptide (TPR) repeat protein
MKNFLYILIVILISTSSVKAQIYKNPIAGKQSHPEMEILQIEINSEHTIISLKVTNKRDNGGWFCADKNIFIRNSKGSETHQLIRSENIPTCPNQYEFKSYGEVLEFQLIFPKISGNIKFLDLVENCNNACFSFNGIILDNNHNQKIVAFEKGFELYQKEEFAEAIPFFEKVLQGKISIQSQIYGLSYYYLISIYNNKNNTEKVETLYKDFLNSDLEDKETYIKEFKRIKIIE